MIVKKKKKRKSHQPFNRKNAYNKAERLFPSFSIQSVYTKKKKKTHKKKKKNIFWELADILEFVLKKSQNISYSCFDDFDNNDILRERMKASFKQGDIQI